MKSFVSHNIQHIIDFTDSLLDKSNAQKCVSITRDNLNILGQIPTVVKFGNFKLTYPSDFLVSDNIQYGCVLGWGFINRNMLSLSKGPGKGYFLVARHGKTSIRDTNKSMPANLAGVTHTCEQTFFDSLHAMSVNVSKQRRRCFA
jgi:hypothetical protein